RRFGKLLLMRLDQALGRLEEALSPRLPVAPLSVERQLAEPVSSTADIESLVTLLAATLKVSLERREEGARMLQLQLFRVDGAVSRIAVGTSRPLREPRLVQKLFHERLAALESDIDAGYGFDLVRLSVLAAARFEMDQGDLAGGTLDRGEDIALLADRIGARLGKQAILRPVAVQSHLPERAVALLPFAEAGNPAAGLPALMAERPIRLFRHPEPLDVPATEVPEGPPLHFRWRRALYRVARAEGPERIAPEWWREGADAPVRNYFRVEDADGRRYWLYRQGLYGATQKSVPRWFMHGLFA
ncbi:MAG: DNA polymerase Y family protein, partial [Alphaproteobacteria bacterium]|nr:DNA polymerase Y family protein [Alphaproteobacteria bacterium]